MSKFFRDLPISPEAEITDDTLIAISFEDTIKTYKATLSNILLHLSTVSFTDKGEIPAQGTITSVPTDSDTCYVSFGDYSKILVGSIISVGADEVIVLDKYESFPNFVLKINGERSYVTANYSYRLPYATFFKQSGELVGIVNANGDFANKLGSLTDEKDYISFSGSSEGVYINSDDLIQSTVEGTRFELNKDDILLSATTQIESSTSGNVANTIDRNGIITSPLQSGLHYKMTSDQLIPDDSAVLINYDDKVFDIQDEWDPVAHVFKPKTAGIYDVSASIILDVPGWIAADEINIFVIRNPDRYDAISAHTHSFSAPLSLPFFISMSVTVQVDAYPAGDIRIFVICDYSGGARYLKQTALLNTLYHGHACVHIAKIA